MSFERYQPSEKNSESGNNNQYSNGHFNKTIKYAPIKIIDNKSGSSDEIRQYPQLNLRFQTIEEVRQDPTVTIPLSFLQQLIQQAYSNKQLKMISNPHQKQEENRNAAVEDLIRQIEVQQKTICFIDEEKKIQNYLLKNQMEFIQFNKEAIIIIESYFTESQSLKPHFQTWIRQIEVKAFQDMLILCQTDSKGQSSLDIFRILFQKLSLEYYTKHAYADILRSNLSDKLKYLSQIGEILNKIAKPQEFYYFKQR